MEDKTNPAFSVYAGLTTPDYEAIVKESERLNHYRTNAEEDYVTTPISVLRYITELESALSFIKSKTESNETHNN